MRLLIIFCFGLLVSPFAYSEDQGEPAIFASEEPQNITYRYTHDRVEYHCDFVRAETAALVRRLGGQKTRISCRGGAPHSRTFDVSVRFTSLRETTKEKSTKLAKLMPVIFNFQSACEIRKEMVEQVLRGFEAYGLESSDECRRGRGSLTYNLKTLSED